MSDINLPPHVQIPSIKNNLNRNLPIATIQTPRALKVDDDSNKEDQNDTKTPNK